MGHTERDCQVEDSEGEEKGRQWGAWLRASPRKGIAIREEEIQQVSKGKKALTFITKPKDPRIVEPSNDHKGKEKGISSASETEKGDASRASKDVPCNPNVSSSYEEQATVTPTGFEFQSSPNSSSSTDKANNTVLLDNSPNAEGNSESGKTVKDTSSRKWRRLIVQRSPANNENVQDGDTERKRKGADMMDLDAKGKEAKEL